MSNKIWRQFRHEVVNQWEREKRLKSAIFNLTVRRRHGVSHRRDRRRRDKSIDPEKSLLQWRVGDQLKGYEVGRHAFILEATRHPRDVADAELDRDIVARAALYRLVGRPGLPA